MTKEEIYARSVVKDVDQNYSPTNEQIDNYIKLISENGESFRFMRATLTAMDEYAKQQSIAFNDWTQENEYFIPEGYTGYIKGKPDKKQYRSNEFIKPDDLYNLFEQSTNNP